VGRQPDPAGHEHNTNDGYVEVVARGLSRRYGTVRSIKLGCGGTTATALRGTPCNRSYGAGSQVQQAERLLAANRSRTALVTIQIGDNDVEGCLSSRGISRSCFDSRLATMRANLQTIARRIRHAAGGHVPVIGIADYDQFLAYWLRGGRPRQIGLASVRFVGKLNATMDGVYRAAGAGAADAGVRFATSRVRTYVSTRQYGRVPLPVARICSWTWACARRPRGPDDHANHTGYRAIGLAVLDTFDAIAGDPSGGAGGP
jgi:lysophospholipase L1-like esterase